MDVGKIRQYAKKTWHFLWHEDSIWSWLANVVLAFVLIKFIVYPGLGLLLGTTFPIVAVISTSMEQDGSFENWWEQQQEWYETRGITKEQFQAFPFKNGFEKGDIMILIGEEETELDIGEVIVFQSTFRSEPIIHRIVQKEEEQGNWHFQTKGDKNADSYPFEQHIAEEQIYGKAIFRIPLLGYVKIIFVEILQLLGIAR